jgi:hypothetical protein
VWTEIPDGIDFISADAYGGAREAVTARGVYEHYLMPLLKAHQVRKFGPEVGPTSAFCSCIPNRIAWANLHLLGT